MTVTQEHIAKLAVQELEELLSIIGDLSYPGYKIAMCKIRGFSYQQCANRMGLHKEHARKLWLKCVQNGHDITLKRIFHIA